MWGPVYQCRPADDMMLQVALSLANLAALMQAQGRASTAEELLRRALSIREDALGPDHPMVRLQRVLVSCTGQFLGCLCGWCAPEPFDGLMHGVTVVFTC